MRKFQLPRPEFDRTVRPIEPLQDVVAYDTKTALVPVHMFLRMIGGVEGKSVTVATSLTNPEALEVTFEKEFKGRHADGTITLTPVAGGTQIDVTGNTNVPFANAILRRAFSEAVTRGNARIQAAADRKAAAPDAPERNDGPQGPEGPHTGL